MSGATSDQAYSARHSQDEMIFTHMEAALLDRERRSEFGLPSDTARRQTVSPHTKHSSTDAGLGDTPKLIFTILSINLAQVHSPTPAFSRYVTGEPVLAALRKLKARVINYTRLPPGSS